MLEVSHMHQNLKETFHTLTVLAPTDIVLKRIPHNQLQRILNDETISKGMNMIYNTVIIFTLVYIYFII